MSGKHEPFERWPDLDALFEQALELSPSERAVFLVRACGDDAELRAELESLLAAHDGSDDFLEDAEAWLGPRPPAPSLPDPDNAQMDSRVGQTVSHYEIIERIGQGGMGVVYAARDTRLDRVVILKFIRSMAGEEAEARSRFTQEARAASALDHPNICTIYEIDETADGQLFIAMAYYTGHTLAARLADGPLAVNQALDIGIAIGSGLESAHEAGIVHRDLKPANVILTDRGEVRILDFGIAKLEGQDQTRTGARLGTAAYMSPEQARGEPVDRRADIWALSVVLHEMLTGQHAFRGGNEQATIYAILNEEPAPIPTGATDVDRLDTIIRRGLAKDPAGRYADMGAMLADLHAVRSGRAPSLALTPDRKTKRRSRLTGFRIAAFATVVLAIIALAAVVVANNAFGPTANPAQPGVPGSALELPTGPSLAVIPFINQSDDPDDVFFSDGLSEAIVAAFSRFTDLFVISLGSTLRYKGLAVDPGEVRREIGADYVLQGTVRRSPGRIRVTAQLSSAATGGSLWSESFELDPTAADLFDAQDSITQQVAGAIGGSTGVIARSRLSAVRDRPTASLDAYECVLRASEYVIDHGPRTHLLARDCLERAIQLDSGYVDAWGWLSYLYAEEARHDWNLRADQYDPIQRALQTGQHAVSLDPAGYIGHFGLAVTYFDAHDLDQFRVEGELAVELNPNDANVLAIIGDYLSEAGDYERGHALLRKSMALNPSHPGWMYSGFFLERYEAGDYEAALLESRRMNMPDSYRSPFFEAAVLGQLGRDEEAAASLRRLQELRPDFVSVEAVRHNLQSYNHPAATVEHLLDGLRKAGLPDRG